MYARGVLLGTVLNLGTAVLNVQIVDRFSLPDPRGTRAQGCGGCARALELGSRPPAHG